MMVQYFLFIIFPLSLLNLQYNSSFALHLSLQQGSMDTSER